LVIGELHKKIKLGIVRLYMGVEKLVPLELS
jgi:hypothetical protein